jgi:hypothetical protein
MQRPKELRRVKWREEGGGGALKLETLGPQLEADNLPENKRIMNSSITLKWNILLKGREKMKGKMKGYLYVTSVCFKNF